MRKKLILVSLMLIVFISMGKIWAKDSVYQGPIYNIFFHPLIVYPKLAFNAQNDHLEYIDEWFVTKKEFKKILAEIYQRGFVLVSTQDIFEEKRNSQGQIVITKKKLQLPEGKRPLILSLDDYNFYPNMKLHGTIHRFWVNKQNELVTITDRVNAAPMIGRNEIPQMLEKFIDAHPDFSFNHARGIIALTGYKGILGYNTQDLLSPQYASQLSEAQNVVRKLKAMGWQFASHSYFHLAQERQTENAFEASEKRWIKEVGLIVGPTPYYIFPFGDSWDKIPTRMRFLKALGYKYFFGVSTSTKIIVEPDAVVMRRFPMDGHSLRQGDAEGVFVDTRQVFDSVRLGQLPEKILIDEWYFKELY